MRRSALFLVFIATGACRGDSPEISDSTTSTQTGGSTTVPTSDGGGSSATSATSAAATSTGDGTTEPAGTTFEPPIWCGEALLDIPVPTPGVMLVLDKSGSMVADPGGLWDHDNDPNTPTVTRWNSLHSAVEQALGDFGDSMDLGAVLFPSTSATASDSEAACLMNAAAEVPIAAMNGPAILAAIPGPLVDGVTMQGATPATRGLERAIQALADAPAERPRVMILVTDGAANCQANAPDTSTLLEVYDDEVTKTVAAAAAMGIHTYVVGIAVAPGVSGVEADGEPDNVDTFEKLNALAIAGGVARPGDEKFFNAHDQAQLGAALQAISMALVPCVITLDPEPRYPYSVEVAPYGSHQVDNCVTEDGWMFLPQTDPEEPLQIELCGEACADYRRRGAFDIKYRCPVG